MSFVYWGGEDAVAGIRHLEEKLADTKNKLTLWALKCLESVWLPQFHAEVAHHMLRSDSTVKTLKNCVEGVRKRQWIYMHVHHPDNNLMHKDVGMFLTCYDTAGPRRVSAHLPVGVPLNICISSQVPMQRQPFSVLRILPSKT